MPRVPEAFLCFAFHGPRPAAGDSTKTNPQARKAHQYAKQEAPGPPAGCDLNLCIGVHRILAFPALSHHGEKPITGFRGSEFSSHLFPLASCVIQRTNSSEWVQQDHAGTAYAGCGAVALSMLGGLIVLWRSGPAIGPYRELRARGTSSLRPQGAEKENPRMHAAGSQSAPAPRGCERP